MKYNEVRRKTRAVQIGNLSIGETSKILIQSMTNTDTHDTVATVAQIKALADSAAVAAR